MDQVRKYSELLFKLWGICALQANINWCVFTLSCLTSKSFLETVVILAILLFDSFFSSCMWSIHKHKFTPGKYTHMCIYWLTKPVLRRNVQLFFIFISLGKWISNTFIVLCIQLSVHCTGIKEKSNADIPCSLDTS